MAPASSTEVRVQSVKVPLFGTGFAIGIDPAGRKVRYRPGGGTRRDTVALRAWLEDCRRGRKECLDYIQESQVLAVEQGQPWVRIESLLAETAALLPGSSESERLGFITAFELLHSGIATAVEPSEAHDMLEVLTWHLSNPRDLQMPFTCQQCRDFAMMAVRARAATGLTGATQPANDYSWLKMLGDEVDRVLARLWPSYPPG